MTEAEAQAMLKALSEHYKQPVMPVSRYCAKLEEWYRVFGESLLVDGKPRSEGADVLLTQMRSLWITVKKSNLLYRLLYLNEDLRQTPCPEHQGKWSGNHWEPCPHGCQYTGWLPNPPKEPTP